MCQALKRATFTAPASALQGVDDTSSSEGSTVDCPDPEEILRKIPELADELDEPDDCFAEGTKAIDPLCSCYPGSASRPTLI